jgi:hypothetical protein
MFIWQNGAPYDLGDCEKITFPLKSAVNNPELRGKRLWAWL